MLTDFPTLVSISKPKSGPGWGGSVDWVPACEPKGRRFDSQSGHLPGSRPGPQWGAWESRTLMFPSLSFSLPSPFSKNK